MGITQEYAEFRYTRHKDYDHWETYEFRKEYIPSHLDYEEYYEPYALRYLMEKGYLREPYFDWATRTVTQ